MVVVAIERAGSQNIVFAELLTSDEGANSKFTFFSEVPMLNVGDFFSRKGDLISFLDADTLAPIEIHEGSTFEPKTFDHPPKPDANTKALLTQAEVEQRLSNLGRVIPKKK